MISKLTVFSPNQYLASLQEQLNHFSKSLTLQVRLFDCILFMMYQALLQIKLGHIGLMNFEHHHFC